MADSNRGKPWISGRIRNDHRSSLASHGCLIVVLAAATSTGCRSEAGRNCQQQFQNAQIVVQNLSGSPEGLDASIAAVDSALGACRTAEREDEIKQLQLARDSLTRHLETAKSLAARPKRTKLSASEVGDLLKHGDPQCPKGMAYNIEGTDKQVSCTGLQPIRMNWSQAREYLSKLGFHVTTTDSPPAVQAERGSEKYLFTYSRTNDSSPPRCLTIYPKPELPWQEAVARATGAQMQKLKLGSPVPTTDGNVALRVDEGKDKLVIRLGSCDGGY
jgi:hypothetical protein